MFPREYVLNRDKITPPLGEYTTILYCTVSLCRELFPREYFLYWQEMIPPLEEYFILLYYILGDQLIYVINVSQYFVYRTN